MLVLVMSQNRPEPIHAQPYIITMATKSMVILFILCLASLVSYGIAQYSPSLFPRSSNFADTKESIMEPALECWSALFDLGWCYGDLVRAAQSGKVDLSIQPTCCKAARSMNSGCWSKMFPYNPFFAQVFQTYCLRHNPFTPPPPKGAGSRTPDLQGTPVTSPTPIDTDVSAPNAHEPSMVSPAPMNAEVPTPNGEGPSMVSPPLMNGDMLTPNVEGPIAYAPFDLPPYAPSPTIEGLFDEGPVEQPWIHF
ncbi:hypothetical protein LXL04_002751 [Taraxacum kok-saghyz]